MRKLFFLLALSLFFLLFLFSGKTSSTETEIFTGYLDSSNTKDDHSITLTDDSEIKFEITYDSTLDISYYNKGIEIRDADGSLLYFERYPVSGIEYGPCGLKTGTYRIHILRYQGYGDYTLTAIYDAQTIPNDTEPNDRPSDAILAPSNGSVQGHLGYMGGGDGTTDWLDIYYVTIPKDGELKYKIAYDSTLDISRYDKGIEIRDADGSLLFYERSPVSGIEYGPCGLKAGTYYIHILRDQDYGGYNLTTMYDAQTIPNDIEPNDIPSDANPAPSNGSIQGHLGYTGGGAGTTDWVDIYYINIPRDGEFKYEIEYDSTLDISRYDRGIEIRDTGGSLKCYERNPVSGIEYGPCGLDAGTYYIHILRDQGYGGYEFHTVFPCDDIIGVWNSVVWYRDSEERKWNKMSTAGDPLTAGDLDGDGIADLIGVWSDGLWVKYSSTGGWKKLSSTLPTHVAAGDFNGDGLDDVMGTWPSGTFYRDTSTGDWVYISTSADLVGAGDIDGDGTDDLIGTWSNPAYKGLWVKFSATGNWVRLDKNLPTDIACGDLNGDTRDDVLGTWPSFGTYYRDSFTGDWVYIATSADLVAAGDIDGDGTNDFIGTWGGVYVGVWVKYTATTNWQKIALSLPTDIDAGQYTGGHWDVEGQVNVIEPILTYAERPGSSSDYEDFSEEGPGGWNFVYREEVNLIPQVIEADEMRRAPGPGEPGFTFIEQKNLVPIELLDSKKKKSK